MDNWEDLYSEVRKRKLKAPEKKKVVQAVEKYGGLLVLEGKYEKAEQIFDFIYANRKTLLYENEFDQILDLDLNQFDLMVIGCPGFSGICGFTGANRSKRIDQPSLDDVR